MVWLDDWANRIPIEIDHTKIDEDLIDFPVLINITSSGVFDALTVSSTVDAYDVLFIDTHGDESSAANAINIGRSASTVVGPKFTISSGIRCIYFDGSDDAMYAVSVPGYDLGTEDFTLDTWINNTLLSSVYRILGHGAVDGTGAINGSWAFGIGTYTSELKIDFSVRIGDVVYNFRSNDLTGNISVNTWNHVAVTRSAGTLFFYLNGVQYGSVSCNYDLTLASANNLSIGYRYSAAYVEIFFGYISRLRISKGIARYLSTFTPPTSYVNDSYTKFLFMNEPNNNIAPSDLEINSYRNPLISKTTTPFNRKAAWDFGAATDNLFFIPNNSYLDLGSNNFTIDGWAYIKSYDSQGRGIISKRASYTTARWVVLYVSNTGYLVFAATITGGVTWDINMIGSYVPINTWFHFAVTRTGNVFDLYYNGIKTNTQTAAGAIYIDTSDADIGQADSSGWGDWYGYIYGLRLSKGIARYSDNFVPADPLDFNSSFNNRKKIAITDANNNQLYTEIERWDHANKKAWLWTKVPTVVSGTNTQLYFYYDKNKSDNTDYVGDTTSIPAKQVWDSNFMAVWHLNSGFATTSYILDSTVSGNHISSVGGGITSANIIPSKIAKGLDLERGSAQYCNIPTTCSLKGQPQASLEAIINLESHTANTSYYYAIYFESTGTSSYTRFGIWVKGISASVSRFESGYRDASTDPTGAAVTLADSYDLALSTSYYFAATYNSDTENFKIFRDNLKIATNTATKAAFANTNPAEIKIGSNPTQYFDGIIDELRVSKTERSEAWVKATYYSNWNDLITFGATEEPPYFFYEGYVNVLGVPSERRVHLYRRSTGQLVDGTTSSGDGYFKLQSRFPEYHYVIVVPELEEDYPLLFDDKIHPEI